MIDSLPNHRTADKCCDNCKNYEGSYEGEGNCKIAIRMQKKKENIWTTYTRDCYTCDLWEGNDDTAGII